MTAPILDLITAAAAPAAVVGGKALRLGQLRRFGLPTPDGFVVTAPALAAGVTPVLREAVAAELARRGWSERPLAARSSAPQEDGTKASFAGQFLTLLNVTGADAVLDALAAVWASRLSPAAAAYRAAHGLSEDGMAVLITPMIPAQAAGVAFTCDPETGRDDRILLNAVRGLGDKLVSGAATGALWTIAEDRFDESLSVISRQPDPATQDVVLNDAQALRLAAMAREAAQALDYGDPAWDLEWVFDGVDCHLVQARPVTARRWPGYPGLGEQETIWSNGNSRDVMPEVMGAMDWLGGRRLADLMLEAGPRLAGFALLDGARRSALLHGRLYLNLSLLQWEAYDGFGLPPAAMNALVGGHHPEITVPAAHWRDRLRRAGHIFKYMRRSGAHRRAGRALATARLAAAAATRSENLDPLDDAALLARIFASGREARRSGPMLFLQGSGGAGLAQLLELVGSVCPDDRHAVTAALLYGGPPSVTARQTLAIRALADHAAAEPALAAWLRAGPPWDRATAPGGAAFWDQVDGFMAAYGHRGIYESYITRPRLAEEPAQLFASLKDLLDRDPAADAARNAAREADAAAARRRVRQALPWFKRGLLARLIRQAQTESNDRECARSALIAHLAQLRRLLLCLGERWRRRGWVAAAEELFDLAPLELPAVANGMLSCDALAARIAHRRSQRAAWETKPAPEVVMGGVALPAAAPSRDPDGAWRGVAVCGGVATGPARLLTSPDQGDRLAAGDILIAPATDPGWTPLLLRAGGLALETGGYLSHGAIVAREFGVPAVVNLPGLMAQARDGEIWEIDGARGVAKILPSAGELI